MGVADNYVNDIRDLTYGEDLRKPIHDGLEVLLNYEGSERPVVVLTEEEHGSITDPDPNTFYAVKKNEEPEPPEPPEPIDQEHYGIKIDKNNSDTSARIEYLYDSVGFAPAYMDFTNERFEYGSWSNAFFVRNNYPVMLKTDGSEDYRLDPNDHSKKLDGTASDVDNLNYDGNAFSCFDCHIWMKFYEDENYQYIEVSNYKLDDSFVDHPYHRGDGSVPDKLYYPMYPGYVHNYSKLRSISGVKASYTYSADTEISYARNNGDIWSIESWSYHLWFNVLLMLISKNFNSQAAFGNGNISGGASSASFSINGSLNTAGQFFGYNTATNSVKTFYCENMWGNRSSRCLGMYNVGGKYVIKMVPPYVYDEIDVDYQILDYKTIQSPLVPSYGYLKDLSFNRTYGILPKTTGGTDSTYVGDYLSSVTSDNRHLLLTGGSCRYGNTCGSWCFDFSTPAISGSWDVGASLYLE